MVMNEVKRVVVFKVVIIIIVVIVIVIVIVIIVYSQVCLWATEPPTNTANTATNNRILSCL